MYGYPSQGWFLKSYPVTGTAAILCALFLLSAFHPPPEKTVVKNGDQVLLDRYLPELKGKRVGLVMNPTARVNGVHMLDTLLARGVDVTALFGPEHGFRGQRGAGEQIVNGVDSATGLPVYSLYGKVKKPTAAMLKNVDILLFDMQDVGARFYTYISTLGLVLEAAADDHKPVWILDRPDPAGGNYMAGWVRKPKYKSFVGAYPVPVAYGMTIGELAKMMVGEGWLQSENKPEIRVIPCEGWHRNEKWPATGLKWIPPSPNLPHFKNALVYLGTCIFEGTSISEGRGTPEPFLTIGSPYISFRKSDLIPLEKKYDVGLSSITFTPRSIQGKSLHPKYEGKLCHGVSIRLNKKQMSGFDPVAFGYDLLRFMLNHSSKDSVNSYLNLLAGTSEYKRFLHSAKDRSPDSYWREQIKKFASERKAYLIYK